MKPQKEKKPKKGREVTYVIGATLGEPIVVKHTITEEHRPIEDVPFYNSFKIPKTLGFYPQKINNWVYPNRRNKSSKITLIQHERR